MARAARPKRQVRKSVTGISSTASFTTTKVEPQMAVTPTSARVARRVSGISQCAEQLDVAAVRSGVAGGLDHHRHAARRRVPEQLDEGVLADAALADRLVP